MADKHASMRRLYEAASALSPPVAGQSDLARRIGQSPQTVNNWETRGVSASGATKTQKLLGISSTWIMEGLEPRYVSASSSPDPRGRQNERQQRMIVAAITLLQHIDDNVLEPIPAMRRAELVDLVSAEIVEHWVDGLGSSDLTIAGRRVIGHFRSRKR